MGRRLWEMQNNGEWVYEGMRIKKLAAESPQLIVKRAHVPETG
jgi:hypothetical protein